MDSTRCSRMIKEIPVRAAHAQRWARPSFYEDHVPQQYFADWRVNLALSRAPDWIVSPPLIGMRRGEINPSEPHCINHIVAAFVGNEEWVIVACDDGDIVGYQVRQLSKAIENYDGCDCQELPWAAHHCHHQPEPCAAWNVGRSAWGLAVHTNARLIATSSNSRRATVFALALYSATPEEEQKRPSSPGSVTSHESAPGIVDREEEKIIILPEARHNLPSIAFCNTGDDPHGNWLIGCDVQDTVYIWDIQLCQIVRTIQAGFCAAPPGSGDPWTRTCFCNRSGNLQHGGWGVMWLDSRSFRKTKSPNEATGCMDFPKEYHPTSPYAWDITSSRDSVRNSAAQYRNRGPNITGANAVDDPSIEDGAMLSISDDEEIWEYEHDLELDPIERLLLTRRRPKPFIRSPPLPLTRPLPACPILIITVRDIMLLQPEWNPTTSAFGSSMTPIVGIHDPLHQSLPLSYAGLSLVSISDRLALHTQIPELGVVIVGSPKGRVGIYTLWQVDGESLGEVAVYYSMETGEMVLPGQKMPAGKLVEVRRVSTDKMTYSLRLDHIVPFKSQEEMGQRPECRLMGIAVGPVQGMMGKSEGEWKRRWRLMMTYEDRSTLAYEIGSSDDGQGVEMLMV